MIYVQKVKARISQLQKNKIFFMFIPIELISYIHSYITNIEKSKLGQSSKYFYDIVRPCLYFTMSHNEYRSKGVNMRIPKKQVCISTTSTNCSNFDYSLLSDFHKLNLIRSWIDADSILQVRNIQYLNLSTSYNLSTIPVLFSIYNQNLVELNLSSCNLLTDVSNLRDLPKLSYLNLSNCKNLVTLPSSFGPMSAINLSGCEMITDVTPLIHVENLNLSGCKLLADVSALCNVKFLNIRYCRFITDISSLVNVHHLNASNCINIADITKFGLRNKSIECLNLSGCYKITDISTLVKNKLRTLDLSNCYRIKDVSSLGGASSLLTNLNLSGCHQISNVSTLGNIRILNLSDCGGITDISALKNNKYLNINNCCRIIKRS